jgi:small basic protein
MTTTELVAKEQIILSLLKQANAELNDTIERKNKSKLFICSYFLNVIFHIQLSFSNSLNLLFRIYSIN